MMRGMGQILLVICVLFWVGCGAKSSKAPVGEPVAMGAEESVPCDGCIGTVCLGASVEESVTAAPEEVQRTLEEIQVQMETLFPAELSVSGWRRGDGVTFFDESNLFEHINGAAEAFFAYGFQLCGTAEYILDGNGGEVSAEDKFILVDVYDMGRPIQAFGMYASELYPESEAVDIGAQGYAESSALNFWKGTYYVKIVSAAPDEKLTKANMELARYIAGKIPGKAEKPSMLSLLPREGLVSGTERFILSDILGYSFLKNGVTATYQVDDEEKPLFVIECVSHNEAKDVLGQFVSYEERSGEEVTRITHLGEEGFAANDRYYKHLMVVRQGRYLVMTLAVTDEAAARELLMKAVENVNRQV